MIDITFSGIHTKYLKTIIDTIASLAVGPKKWLFSPEKLMMGTMEESASIFVSFEIKKDFFEEYKVEETSLGLSFEELKKIFSRNIKDDAKIRMYYSDDENKLVVNFKEGRNEIEYKLNISVVDEEEEQSFDYISQINELTLNNVVEFDGGGHLRNILYDIGIVAPKENKTIYIKILDQTDLILELDQNTTSISAKSVIKKGDGSPIREIIAESKEVTCIYDMEALEKIFKIDSIADSSKMSFAEEHPLRLNFTFANSNIEFMYMVAPLEEEENFEDA